MLFKSAIITQGSGSVGGLTVSHNRGGLYFRARTIPTNPGTSFQTAVRNAVASLVNLWHDALDAAQRETWDTYAANVAFVNRLGDPTFLSGLNQYVRSNVPRLQTGLVRVDDAPATFNTGEFTAMTFSTSATVQLTAVTFTEADDWVNEDDAAAILYLSRPQNDTINFFKGPYRFAGSVLGNLALPETSPQTITTPFVVVEDQRLFGYIRVSRADGRLSVKQDFDHIVGA